MSSDRVPAYAGWLALGIGWVAQILQSSDWEPFAAAALILFVMARRADHEQ